MQGNGEAEDDERVPSTTDRRGSHTRRRLLAAIGGAGTIALAGCTTQSEPTPSRTDTTSPEGAGVPTATDTATPTSAPTETATDEPTDTPADPTLLWVAPDGDDDAAGTEDDPLRTFDAAVNRRAEPGDTIRAKPGVYRQFLTMRRGGEPGAPITITGPPDGSSGRSRGAHRSSESTTATST